MSFRSFQGTLSLCKSLKPIYERAYSWSLPLIQTVFQGEQMLGKPFINLKAIEMVKKVKILFR